MDKFDGMRVIYEEDVMDNELEQFRTMEMASYNKKGNVAVIVITIVMFLTLLFPFTSSSLLTFESTGAVATASVKEVRLNATDYVNAAISYFALVDEELTYEMEQLQATCGVDPTDCLDHFYTLTSYSKEAFAPWQATLHFILILTSMVLLIISPMLLLFRAIHQLNMRTNEDYSLQKYLYLLPLGGVILFTSVTYNSNQFGIPSRDNPGYGLILYAILAVAMVVTAVYKNRLGIDPKRRVSRMDREVKNVFVIGTALLVAFVLLMGPIYKVTINKSGLAIGGEYSSNIYLNEKFTFLSKENRDEMGYTTIRNVQNNLGSVFLAVDDEEYLDAVITYSEHSNWIVVMYQTQIDNHAFLAILAGVSYVLSRIFIFFIFVALCSVFGGAFVGHGYIKSYVALPLITSGALYMVTHFINKLIWVFTGIGREGANFQYVTTLNNYFLIIGLVFILFYNSTNQNNSRIIASYNPMFG